MKRFVVSIFSLLFMISPSIAEDAGLWDNFGDVNFYLPEEQTAVSDKQFEETVDKVKEKQKNILCLCPKNLKR